MKTWSAQEDAGRRESPHSLLAVAAVSQRVSRSHGQVYHPVLQCHPPVVHHHVGTLRDGLRHCHQDLHKHRRRLIPRRHLRHRGLLLLGTCEEQYVCVPGHFRTGTAPPAAARCRCRACRTPCTPDARRARWACRRCSRETRRGLAVQTIMNVTPLFLLELCLLPFNHVHVYTIGQHTDQASFFISKLACSTLTLQRADKTHP